MAETVDPLQFKLQSIFSSAVRKGNPAPMTWAALEQELGGAEPIGYEEFDARWKQEEQLPLEQQVLHSLVKSYGRSGVQLNTGTQQPDVEAPGEGGQQDVLGSTAMAATKRAD